MARVTLPIEATLTELATLTGYPHSRLYNVARRLDLDTAAGVFDRAAIDQIVREADRIEASRQPLQPLTPETQPC